jgi:hypothetical protein
MKITWNVENLDLNLDTGGRGLRPGLGWISAETNYFFNLLNF